MPGSKALFDKTIRAAVNLHSGKIPLDLAKSSAALFSAYGGAKATLPDLSYDYDALERTFLVLCVCNNLEHSL
jgi:hypothetical protein